MNDLFCAEETNKPIIHSVPSAEVSTKWFDGRTHIEMLGANDRTYRTHLLNVLGGASDTIDGVCQDLVFGDWI